MNHIYNHKWFPRIFYTKPDGGKESGVTGYFLIEWKILFSIGLLRFDEGSREAYHNHAFNACTWWLTGFVTENHRPCETAMKHKDFKPSLWPKITKRDCFHKVVAHQKTWALTIRGPWVDTWKQYSESTGETVLTHGRKVVSQEKPKARNTSEDETVNGYHTLEEI